jgi:uncharacterized lipoprotein YddW (UPF0748 family)
MDCIFDTLLKSPLERAFHIVIFKISFLTKLKRLLPIGLLLLLACFLPHKALALVPNSFVLFDLSQATSSTTSIEEVPLHPQKTLDYALTHSVVGQGTYFFPKSVSQFDYILNDVQEGGIAKPPLVLLYGKNSPDESAMIFVDTLIRRPWPVVLVAHPFATIDTKKQWEAEFKLLWGRYRSFMEDRLGTSQLSVLDTALAGSLTVANPFPVKRLSTGCDLYTLPSPFIYCGSGLPPLGFVSPIQPKPISKNAPKKEASKYPIKSTSSNLPRKVIPTNTTLATSSVKASTKLKPSYDVLKRLYDLANQWKSMMVVKSIQECYAPFEEEASNYEQEYNSLETDVWQRMQAFEFLGKNVDKIQYAEQMNQIQSHMDALKPLRKTRDYKEYRQKSKALIIELMFMKQKLLFPNMPNQIHGVWFDRGSIVSLGNSENLKIRLSQLARAGMTDIFVETINAGFPVYSNSIMQPIQNPLIKDWDPLLTAVNEGHALGLRVHAWVWCFAVGNTRHNRILGLPSDDRGPLLNMVRFENQQLLMNDGSEVPKGQHEYWLDPASYDAQEFLVDWYAEIVDRYAVDGLQLDYIRYPFQSTTQRAGYNSLSLYNFYQATGLRPTSENQEAFDRWKIENISRFVSKVNKTLKAKKSDLILSAAVFPLPTQDRLKAIQQDWETWSKRGWIDWLIPMAYTENTVAFNQQITQMKQSLKPTRTLLVSGVGLHKLEGAQRIERSEQLHKNGVSGWTWFANAHLDANTLNILPLTTQQLPYGGKYLTSTGKALGLYASLLRQTFSSPNAEEAQVLQFWDEFSTYVEVRKLEGFPPVFVQQNWVPLLSETQRLVNLRFSSVPALKQWLNGELDRLDAQMRWKTWSI